MPDRLPVTDAGWLLIEGRETPMHVAGLQLFTLPDDVPPEFVRELYAWLRKQTDIQRPFDQRLQHPYGRAGTYAWETDPGIDLEYHVRHSALPQPGRIRELLALTSRLHSTLLDRHRPLWEIHLVEGLDDGRIAVYTKFHHSMFDGVGAIRQMLRSFSPDEEARDLPPPWCIPPVERTATGEASALEVLRKTISAPVGQASAAVGATRALAKQLISKVRGVEAEVVPFQSPNSILNGRITGARRFAADSYDLERVKALSKELGATLNDVVLTVCSGALRAYLDTIGGLPDKPLIALCPVSIRRDDESTGGNAISMLLADLATDEPDPLQRLARIKASMDRGKERLASMNQTELIDYALLLSAPTILGNLAGTAGRTRPVYNVVISNVPGPRNDLFWNGARMDGMYPVSLLPDGQALNITLTSYVDTLAFGVTACRKTLPHVQRLLDHFEDALTGLEAVA